MYTPGIGIINTLTFEAKLIIILAVDALYVIYGV